MDWSIGFSSKFYLTVVDPLTWRDMEHYDLTDGSISKNLTGLRESADISNSKIDTSNEKWIRIWLEARQSGDSVSEPIFTGLMSCPTHKINGQKIEVPIECYSVLKPVDDILLPRGYYVPVETNGAEAVKRLLSVTPAPVVIKGTSPALTQAIIAESGESNLTMADKILDCIGWRLVINGDGKIIICPIAEQSTERFGTAYDVLESEIDITQDRYSCPNCLRVVWGGLTAIAKDEDADSILSIANRGREIWVEETSVSLSDNETVAEYAARRLKELQMYGLSIQYTRRFIPNVNPGDIVTLDYPAYTSLSKVNYRIDSQDISIGSGIKVSETALNI